MSFGEGNLREQLKSLREAHEAVCDYKEELKAENKSLLDFCRRLDNCTYCSNRCEEYHGSGSWCVEGMCDYLDKWSIPSVLEDEVKRRVNEVAEDNGMEAVFK